MLSNLSLVRNVIAVYSYPPLFDGHSAKNISPIYFYLGEYRVEVGQARIHAVPPVHKDADILHQYAEIIPHALKLGHGISICYIGCGSAEHVIKQDTSVFKMYVLTTQVRRELF